jgi:hypothetical protein
MWTLAIQGKIRPKAVGNRRKPFMGRVFLRQKQRNLRILAENFFRR